MFRTHAPAGAADHPARSPGAAALPAPAAWSPPLRLLRAPLLRLLSLIPLLGLLLACGREEPSLWKRAEGRWSYDGLPFDAADPATLQPIDGRFARDAVQAYYRGRPVPGSHGPSFAVLGENEARDRRAVYWADTYRRSQDYFAIRHIRMETLAEADPARYRVLTYGYGSDGQRAYRQGQRLLGVREPATFEVLTPRLARDARRGYFEDIEIAESDGATFEIINPHDDAWVRDRQRAWHVRFGQPGPGQAPRREVVLLGGAQAQNLRPLGREYASDGRRVWWRGQHLKDAEVASFTILEGDEGPDARDARGAFHHGRRAAPGN